MAKRRSRPPRPRAASPGRAGPIERALSIRQPWASAIVLGQKTIENRSWQTNYRGTVAIHASASTATLGKYWPVAQGVFAAAGWLDGLRSKPGDYRRGAILGTVDIVDCVPYWCPSVFGNPWAADWDFCWRLANPVLFARPIACGGKLNLWRLPAELAAEVAAAYFAAVAPPEAPAAPPAARARPRRPRQPERPKLPPGGESAAPDTRQPGELF